MKIHKIAKSKQKLLKLKLIKTKVYKKNHNNFIQIEDIVNRLRKAFYIIYKYHTNNKRILFVGSSTRIDFKLKTLIKKTKHIIIPESIWMSGLLTNQASCFKYLSKNQKIINRKVSKILFQVKKKSDLIVILNNSSNVTSVKEGYVTRTPVISINCDLDILDPKPSYKIPGNFKFTKKKIRNTFFYSILFATLKKANKNSNRKLKINKLFLKPKKSVKYSKNTKLKN